MNLKAKRQIRNDKSKLKTANPNSKRKSKLKTAFPNSETTDLNSPYTGSGPDEPKLFIRTGVRVGSILAGCRTHKDLYCLGTTETRADNYHAA